MSESWRRHCFYHNLCFVAKTTSSAWCGSNTYKIDQSTYGPAAPGREKPSIFVLLFFQRQIWCGFGNKGIKVWSIVVFPKWMGDLNYWRNKFKKSIFIDFLMDFWEIYSLDWKTHQLRHYKSSIIWHLHILNNFGFCELP